VESSLKVRKMLSSITEYVVYFMLFYYVRIPIHEWIHLDVTRIFGGNGYIEKTFWGAQMVFTKMPTHPTVAAFAGGVGLGLIFLFLIYLDWIDWDVEEIAALLPHCLSEFSYGVFEGLLIPGVGLFGTRLTQAQFIKYGSMVGVSGWTFGLILGWHIWFSTAEWLRGDKNDRNS